LFANVRFKQRLKYRDSRILRWFQHLQLVDCEPVNLDAMSTNEFIQFLLFKINIYIKKKLFDDTYLLLLENI
jgi:hypothetical protein